jgi:GAF domain-containing protein/HAMP domain-containing protein
MNISNFFNTSLSDFDNETIPENQRALQKVLTSAVTYIPLLLVFNALGFITIYLLAALGLLDAADPKLLAVAGISLVAAVLHIPIINLLKRNQIDLVILSLFALDGTASVVQMFLWQGSTSLAFFTIIALSPALVFLPLPGIKARTRLAIAALAILFGISTVAFELGLRYERLQTSNLSGMAGLTIYATVMFIMIALVITSAIQFRSIAGRLIVTFAFITLASAASTLVVSSLVNLFRDREKTFEQLRVISDLKANQMFAVLDSFETNAGQTVVGDPFVLQRVLFLLEQQPGSLSYNLNYELVDDAIRKSATQSPEFQDVYIFDETGTVIIASAKQNENRVVAGEAQFVAATKGQKFIVINSPFVSQQSIIILTRIERNGEFKGAFAVKIRPEVVRAIFEQESALGQTLETYLVDDKFSAFSLTRAGENTPVQTLATTSIFTQKKVSGEAIYNNYAAQQVLGSYQYLPELNVVLISEIEQVEVAQKIFELLLTNVLVGIFTALMTLAAVYTISRSISSPIVNLAEKAVMLAQGDLSARVNLHQSDEIGTLANTFNTLASELQSLIQTLEQKVTDRTEDLQKQANRLRLAAEVARDSTTARDLDELLTRSAQLVMDRFGFYHTGVFMIDPQHEYAVLRASPTEAGQEMLRREHRLRIGQVGIVGYVAATGEPRIALDTGLDVVYFNNPLLPNTRSELGLPLVVNDQIIGVLDVQSEEAEAFTQEDIATLQIMADQLALAIQKAQFADELQRNLQELEFAYQRFTLSSWKELAEEDEQRVGYKYDGLQILPIQKPSKESLQAIRQKQTVIKKDSGGDANTSKTTLAIPIRVREQVIGAINLEFASHELPQDTVRLVEEISNRLAMSLENARLYSETQKLAEKERLAGDISNRIGSSINVETILRTTVQELSRFAPGAEIMVSLTKDKDD